MRRIRLFLRILGKPNGVGGRVSWVMAWHIAGIVTKGRC